MYIISQDKQVIVNIENNCTSVYAFNNEVRVKKIDNIYLKVGTEDFDCKLAAYSTSDRAENIVNKIHELVAKGEMVCELPKYV